MAHFSCANISMVIHVSFPREMLMRPLWHQVKLSQPLQLMHIHVLLSFSLSPLPLALFLSLHHFFSQGNVTFSCAEPVSIAVTFTDSQSFLQLPGLTSWSSGVISVALQFRTWNKAGLLLTFDLPQQEGAVWMFLSEARLRLQITKAGKAQLELSAGQPNYDLVVLFW